MLTLDVMKKMELTARPLGQMVVAQMLRLNYWFPPSPTNIRVEGFDRIPEGPVYIAMNHTDRYNYWPFQYQLWKERDRYTATWVKGKYYNHPALREFMIAMNNIPTPSKGYLITVDTANVLGEPPSSELYRHIRKAFDEGWSDVRMLEEAPNVSVEGQVRRVVDTPRDLLGIPFDPLDGRGYIESLHHLFGEMMDRFVELNEEGFDLGLKILVFPEGTRSKRLGTGKPGLAQMAIRTGATVVPVGCNGSDVAYPGNSPIASGGDILYRVGDPLTPDDELADFQIDDPYQPFTDDAEKYSATFDEMTELVMDRINDLLDPAYRRGAGEGTADRGAARFM